MKKLFLMAVFFCMAMAYTSCKKDDVTPINAVTHQTKSMDESGGQNDPTPPPPPQPH